MIENRPRVEREPDPDWPTIVKSDGTHWHSSELRKAFGDKYEGPQGDSGYNVRCIEDPSHLQGTYIYWHNNQDGTVGFKYDCRRCRTEFNIDLEAQFSIFSAWLKDRELVDGRWLRHSNPFDHDLDASKLEFVQDQEGNHLFYRGGVHFVYGKPGTCKSWLALWTLKFANVRLWDFENGITGTLGRLKALGVDREAANGYTVPSSPDEVTARVREYVSTKPDILCIDGFSGFADVMGINPESNSDVMRAFTEVFYPLKRVGVTVIVLDHLPKDSGTEDFPIGAQTKKSQADAAFLFKSTSSNKDVDIFVSKDRHGELLERCEPGSMPRRFGRLTLESEESAVSIRISPAYKAQVDGDLVSVGDVELMQAIYDYVEAHPECNKGEIERNVLGKTERKRKALSALKDGGYLVTREVGTSHVHTVGKEFIPQWTPIGA